MSIIKDLHAQLEVFESEAKEEIKRFLEFVGLRVPDAVVNPAPVPDSVSVTAAYPVVAETTEVSPPDSQA